MHTEQSRGENPEWAWSCSARADGAYWGDCCVLWKIGFWPQESLKMCGRGLHGLRVQHLPQTSPFTEKSQDPQKSKGPAYHYHSSNIGKELLFSPEFLQSVGDRSSKVSIKSLYCLRKGSLLLMKALPRVNERHTPFNAVIASCCTWCWQQCQWVRMPVMIHWMPGSFSSSSSFA